MTDIKEVIPVLPKPAPCPAPFDITLDATTPNIVNADFNAAELAIAQGAMNYNQPNKAYAHTFVWKPTNPCCKVTYAVLTVTLKALQGGASATSSDAGNDSISVLGTGGVAIQPYAGPVYTGPYPFAAGKTVTKTWNIGGAALDKLNTAHTLSFFVQDDSSVLSATLHLVGCCLG